MDESVLRGMAKWPNVPAVYGWLALDRRGRWLIRGESIGNPAIVEFIERNYERDAQGHWFFQNGPQRVFVDLQYTPFVYRTTGAKDALELIAHTGARVRELRGAWLDENGSIVLETEIGPGILDDRDLDLVAALLVDAAGKAPNDEALEAAIENAGGGAEPSLWIETPLGRVKLGTLRAADAPQRFGYAARPAPPNNHPERT
jgi:hypothetical protein